MMKQVMAAVMVMILMTGCSWFKDDIVVPPKIVYKIKYVKQEKYDMQTIDVSGVYIENVSKACVEDLVKLNELWSGINNYYVWQVEEYDKAMK